MNVIPVYINKEIESGDNIVDLILKSHVILDGDILVFAQKIISKQEGRLVQLSTVIPSLLAQGISSQYQKDPRIVDLILQESKKIVRMSGGVLIVETNHGFICANAGIDESNVQEGYATLLPIDSTASATNIHKEFFEKTQKSVAVIISDTFGRPFRMGQTNYAIGISGISPILDYAGSVDHFGKILRVTAIAIVDELAASAELIMKKNTRCPIAIIRNYEYTQTSPPFTSIIRKENEDLFR